MSRRRSTIPEGEYATFRDAFAAGLRLPDSCTFGRFEKWADDPSEMAWFRYSEGDSEKGNVPHERADYFTVDAAASCEANGESERILGESNREALRTECGDPDATLREFRGPYGSVTPMVLMSAPWDPNLFEMIAGLDDYPLADEEDFSRREWEACEEQWNDWGRRDFLRALRMDVHGLDADMDAGSDADREAFSAVMERGSSPDDMDPERAADGYSLADAIAAGIARRESDGTPAVDVLRAEGMDAERAARALGWIDGDDMDLPEALAIVRARMIAKGNPPLPFKEATA